MVVFEIEQSSVSYFENYKNEYPESMDIIKGDSVLGTNDIIQIILLLSPATMPFITKIAIELIKNNKKAKIKWKGGEIAGLTEKNAVKMFEKILELEENKSGDRGDNQLN